MRGLPLKMGFEVASRRFFFELMDFSDAGYPASFADLGYPAVGSTAAAAGGTDGADGSLPPRSSPLPTEVFVPRYQYPAGVDVEVSSGRFEYLPDRQLLLWWHGAAEGPGNAGAGAGAAGGSAFPWLEAPTHWLRLADPRNRPRGSKAGEWAALAAAREAGGVLRAGAPGRWAGKEAKHVPVVTLAAAGAAAKVTVVVPHGLEVEHFVDAIWVKNQNDEVRMRGKGGGGCARREPFLVAWLR